MANPNPNQENLKPFKKGDPRINRYGRPKSFDVLRKLAQRIASEPAAIKDGHTVTKIEAMLNNMMASKNAAHNKTFLEYAFGKVPEEINIGNKDGNPLEIGVNVIDYRNGLAEIAPRSIPNSDAPRKDENIGDGSKMGKDGSGRGADDDGA